MNSYDRVFSMLKNGKADRTPVCPFVMAFASKYANIPYSQYCTDYRSLAEAQIKTVSRFQNDLLVVDSDAYREASACGAILEFPEDDLPIMKRNAINGLKDFSFKLPEISVCERLVDKIEGIRYLNSRFNKEIPILGWVEAPFQSAALLMGINEFLFKIYDEPKDGAELLEYTSELAYQFGIQQHLAGADILGVGDAVASLVSPSMYQNFVYPYTKNLIDRLRKSNVVVKYHICGDSSALLDIIAGYNADIVNIDAKVDIGNAFKAFRNISCVKGNINPVAVLKDGTPALLKQEIQKCLDAVDGPFILSPGCEVPKDTPHKNMDILINSVRFND